jgi:hypothetical protein
LTQQPQSARIGLIGQVFARCKVRVCKLGKRRARDLVKNFSARDCDAGTSATSHGVGCLPVRVSRNIRDEVVIALAVNGAVTLLPSAQLTWIRGLNFRQSHFTSGAGDLPTGGVRAFAIHERVGVSLGQRLILEIVAEQSLVGHARFARQSSVSRGGLLSRSRCVARCVARAIR